MSLEWLSVVMCCCLCSLGGRVLCWALMDVFVPLSEGSAWSSFWAVGLLLTASCR